MERIWTKNYPAGVPADINVEQFSSLVALLEDSFTKYADDKAYVLMDKAITYGELDTYSNAYAAYLQSLGLVKGDRVAIMMPQRAAISRGGCRHFKSRTDRGERQSALHGPGTGTPAQRFRCQGDHHFGEFRRHAAGSGGPHVGRTHYGGIDWCEMLGTLKGGLVNFIIRHVKKAVPAFNLPNSVSFKAALAAGMTMKLDAPGNRSR